MGMSMTARISSGTARMTLKSCRTGVRIHEGETFPAARKAKGSEMTAPIIVPIQAMCTDSRTLPGTPRSMASLNAGGAIRRNTFHASPGALRRRSMVTSRPEIDQTTATTTRAASPHRRPARRGATGLSPPDG